MHNQQLSVATDENTHLMHTCQHRDGRQAKKDVPLRPKRPPEVSGFPQRLISSPWECCFPRPHPLEISPAKWCRSAWSYFQGSRGSHHSEAYIRTFDPQIRNSNLIRTSASDHAHGLNQLHVSIDGARTNHLRLGYPIFHTPSIPQGPSVPYSPSHQISPRQILLFHAAGVPSQSVQLAADSLSAARHMCQVYRMYCQPPMHRHAVNLRSNVYFSWNIYLTSHPGILSVPCTSPLAIYVACARCVGVGTMSFFRRLTLSSWCCFRGQPQASLPRSQKRKTSEG
ncbi:hypothetical protein DL98DRAFT_315681 [Cadophora sp. DSE1049]|nr:hypothetical protein DL98DRAFT_315681 [Cadophora sp. DSE1049]